MKYHEMTKNYIFREFECGLSVEQTSKLCLKSVRTINDWDKGKPIPPECKRLMRFYKRLELSDAEEWAGFKMSGNYLELPTGQRVSPQEILAGIGLLEIGAERDLRTNTKLLGYARVLAELLVKKNGV
ncbi:regulator [Vibrio harveyi]|nr:regulator [Vibrio harveyi]